MPSYGSPSDWFRECIAKAATDDALADCLLQLLNSGMSVWRDGSLIFTRARVTAIGRLVLEVYPRDHPPPHFHVRCPDFVAKFAISDCSLLEGEISSSDHDRVRWFFENGGQSRIQKRWDETRPGEVARGAAQQRRAV